MGSQNIYIGGPIVKLCKREWTRINHGFMSTLVYEKPHPTDDDGFLVSSNVHIQVPLAKTISQEIREGKLLIKIKAFNGFISEDGQNYILQNWNWAALVPVIIAVLILILVLFS